MATYGHTFTSGDTLTPTKLNNARTVTDIVNADIKSDAAIAGTKIAPNFGSQNVATTGTSSAANFRIPGKNTTALINYLGTQTIVTPDADDWRTSIRIASESDTTPNLIAFWANNEQRAVIDASGNVGIGTSSPTKRLTVVGPALNGAGNEALWVDANTVQFAVRRESGGGGTVEIGTPNNHNLGIFTNGTRVMSIGASGNVGIGTTSPTNIAGYSTLEINNSTNGGLLRLTNGTQTLWSYVNSDGGFVGTVSNHPLIVQANNAERMRIKSTGQVRFQPLSADPSGAEAGDVYYNSSSNKLKVYNGSSWVDLH
jgi:hypothetical protein